MVVRHRPRVRLLFFPLTVHVVFVANAAAMLRSLDTTPASPFLGETSRRTYLAAKAYKMPEPQARKNPTFFQNAGGTSNDVTNLENLPRFRAWRPARRSYPDSELDGLLAGRRTPSAPTTPPDASDSDVPDAEPLALPATLLRALPRSPRCSARSSVLVGPRCNAPNALRSNFSAMVAASVKFLLSSTCGC